MTMEAADALALADAVRRLEHPGPGVRLASLLGSPVERLVVYRPPQAVGTSTTTRAAA